MPLPPVRTPGIAPPAHIAIIMDGNGRWAQQRRHSRAVGHRAGARAVNRTIDFCLEKNVKVLTLFAFSSENWARPVDEVDALMRLFMIALEREVEELHRRGVQIRFIGERARFAQAIALRMEKAEQQTAGNQRLVLAIAASYGGQQDMTKAVRCLATEVAQGRLQADQIDESHISSRLALSDLPAPDLFIRTGGDMRISNFLLWQLAYTELWFTDTLWPDVDANTLQQAINDYQCRERRFGLTSAQIAEQPPGNGLI